MLHFARPAAVAHCAQLVVMNPDYIIIPTKSQKSTALFITFQQRKHGYDIPIIVLVAYMSSECISAKVWVHRKPPCASYSEATLLNV